MPAIRIRRSLSPERNPFCPQIDNPQALVWALRALTSTPAHNGFLKEHSVTKNEVLEWLGFTSRLAQFGNRALAGPVST